MPDLLISEQRLRELLEPLRHSPVPDLDRLPRRAPRHPSRWPVAVPAAIVLVAAAAAGYRYVTPYGDSAPPPICDRAQVVSGSTETRRLALDDLPASLLLGWPGGAGSAPTAAYAREDVHSCAYAPTLRLIALTGSQVTATIDLGAFPAQSGSSAHNPDGGPTWGGPTWPAMQRHGSRISTIRSPGDGFVYSLAADGVPESDVESLMRSATIADGEWAIDEWPGTQSFDVVQTTGTDSDGVTRWWLMEQASPDADSEPILSLHVIESGDPVLLSAEVGDRLVTVDGQPALQDTHGSVTWKPSANTRATLSGELTPAALLARAAEVVPLSPDDPRLTDIAR